MQNVQFIRDMLYSMKRDYGLPIRYGRIATQELNYNTGENVVVKHVYSIRKAVVITNTLNRRFVQDIAYLAANKNFTYGGLFDENSTFFIIDARDLPKNVTIEMDDFIFYEHGRYYVKKVERLAYNCGYIVSCLQHEGANPFDVQPAKVLQSLDIQQEINYDLS